MESTGLPGSSQNAASPNFRANSSFPGPDAKDDFCRVAELDGTTGTAEPCLRTCHVCQATVPCGRSFCTSCGHPLCNTCICPIPEGAAEAHNAFANSGGVHLTLRDGETLTSYNRSVPPSPVKTPADPVLVFEAGHGRPCTRSPQETRPYESQEPGRQPAPNVTSFPKPRAPRKSSASVKDNPFVAADRQPRAALRQMHGSQAPKTVAPSEYVPRRSDRDSQEEPCSDAACRATHPRYRPYRHNVQCSSRLNEPSGAEAHPKCYEAPTYRPSQRGEWPCDANGSLHRRQPTHHGEPYRRQSPKPPHQCEGDPLYVKESMEEAQPRSLRSRERTCRDDARSQPKEYVGAHRAQHARERTFDEKCPKIIEYVKAPRRYHREETRNKPPVPRPEPIRSLRVEPEQKPVRRRLAEAGPAPVRQQPPQLGKTSSPPVEPQQKLSHSKSVLALYQKASYDGEPEDFREVRSRLRKASSQSSTRPPAKSRPDPPPTHYSPPARLETTPKDEELKPIQGEAIRPKDSKDKEKRVRDDDNYLDNARPAKPAPNPGNHSKCLDEPRRRCLEQAPSCAAPEGPRDRVPRQAKSMVPGPAPAPAPQQPGTTAPEPAPAPRRPWVEGNDHDCGWRDRYMNLQQSVEKQGRTSDIGLEGLTIVLHMKGRDDLVINTDFRNLA